MAGGGESPIPTGPLRWQECVGDLARAAGRSPRDIDLLLTSFISGTVNTSPDFMALVVAVSAAESNLAPHARSATSDAVGLMQVTDVGAREAEYQCPFLVREHRRNTFRIDPIANVGYGTCLLRHYLEQVNGNTFLALVLYNGGYRQLTRLETNATLSIETREYVLRVHHYLRRCQ